MMTLEMLEKLFVRASDRADRFEKDLIATEKKLKYTQELLSGVSLALKVATEDVEIIERYLAKAKAKTKETKCEE